MTALDHRDGVPWHKAPLPWRWHRCRPQSMARLPTLMVIERCACGAARLDRRGPWVQRNSRRKA